MNIMGIAAEPGQKTLGYLDVSTTAIGEPLRIPVHVYCGQESGSTVLIGSSSHGNEVTTILALTDVLSALDPAGMHGTMIAVPLMNPLSFDAQSPMSHEDDWPLDESFPTATSGAVLHARGWVTQQIAGVLAELINESACVIDLHAGGFNVVSNYVWINQTADEGYNARLRELANAFGTGAVKQSAAPSASLADYAALAKVPAITPEFGGVLPVNAEIARLGVQGVLNVLRHLGVVEGEVQQPASAPVLYATVETLRVKDGGVFYPEVFADKLNRTVAAGTVLGRVVNPFTLEELQTVSAPFAETMLLSVRGAYSHLQPGDDAYVVADTSSRTSLI